MKGAYTVEHPPLLPAGPPTILASVLCDPDHISIVGEMAYFGDYRRTASVRSSGSTYTLCLKPRHIDIIMNGFPALTRVTCQQFTRRLRKPTTRCGNSSASSPWWQKHLVPAGEVLFAKGDPSLALYQLLIGSIAIERDGQRTIATNEGLAQGFLEPEAYFRKQKHAVTAIAQTDCILVSVDQTHIETLVRCYPDLASRVMEG